MKPSRERVRVVGQEAGHRLRRYVRKVWSSRGGGFYGFVATLMFLYLEVVDLAGDVLGFPALVGASLGGVIGWGVTNVINAVLNLVRAAIWPMSWLLGFGIGVRSALLLGATYVTYRVAHPHILRLLQEPEGDADPLLTAPTRPTLPSTSTDTSTR